MRRVRLAARGLSGYHVATRQLPHQSKVLRSHDFLIRVRELAEAKLPPEARRFDGRLRMSLMQLYHGDPRIHYEVWLQRKTGRIEIGLHFEGERDDNYRWAQILSERVLEIRSQLGPGAELEEWTRSWTRLHQTVPLAHLDDALAEQVADRLAAMMRVMEPILEQEAAATSSEGKESAPQDRPRRGF